MDRQDSATTRTERQNSVTNGLDGWSIFGGKKTGATGSAQQAAAPKGPAAATSASSSVPAASAALLTKAESDARVVQSLKDALAAAGINAEGLGLAAHEDVVTYPGGSYINRYISVQGNDHIEGLMTDLVAIDPKVAVLDIQRMMGMLA